MHCTEELEQKREAIRLATDAFVQFYHQGFFENNDQLLHHMIENLYSLLTELNRG